MKKGHTATNGNGLLVGNPEQLRAFREGQAEVLTLVFQDTAPMLRSLLFACGLKSAADVDDALQTTFTRAFTPQARLAYSGLSPYESYLKTIARNVVRDLKKSGRARYEILSPETMELSQAQAEWSDPRAQVEQAQALELRDRFFAELRPTEQSVYTTCFRQGQSEREAAEQLSMTRHKLRNAVAAIKRQLNRFIREQGLDE